jgi:transposase-like protein
LQTCIVHLLRHSQDFANWKQRTPLAVSVRAIYTAASAEAALSALDTFESGPWGRQFPTIVAAWRRAWTHVIPVLCVSTQSAARDLHDERARERQRARAEDHQDARTLSDR